MKSNEALKLFGLNNLIIESDIRKLERDYDIDLGHRREMEGQIDQKYYPQFPERLRREAAMMSRNYQIFYCLENSIRELISERLKEKHGPNWWDSEAVPDCVRKSAEQNQKKEIESGVTPRSTELIDFTNFGELGEIIRSNRDVFDDMFGDLKAVNKILATLNALRAPIAHCKALAEDEERRLSLGLGDWFRQIS